MADQKITALTAHTALIDTDVVPVVDITAGATKKTTWANIKSVLKTYFDGIYSATGHNHSGVYAPVLGADDNYVTDAEKTVIGNTSGTNSGNETTTTLGATINGATAKTSAVDADMLLLMDSADSNHGKKLSWAYVKSVLKTYFDTIYAVGTIPVKASGAEINTGTDDAKFATAAAILASKITSIDVQTFTGNGTWTRPTTYRASSRVVIELWGGGGGGGGSAANAGSGGGGGGAYNRVECLASALGSTESVTVGAAANGGASSGAVGTAGNTSSFGTKAYAYGGGGGGNTDGGSGGSGYGGGGGGIMGVGGNGSGGAGGAGGAPLGGAQDSASTFGGGGSNLNGGTAFTVYGGTGGSRQNAAIPANTYGGGGGGGVSAPGTAGTGGTSVFGGAGGNGANGTGNNGTAPGGGGGGGGGVGGGAGGNGARGEVRVTTYI